MASALARRIARLEQRRAAVAVNVVIVGTGETDGEAFARHIGVGPCIVMPSRATDDELADLEPVWAAQQRRLQAEARDQTRRLNEGSDNGHDTRRNARSNTRSRRILSASSPANATRVAAWKPG